MQVVLDHFAIDIWPFALGMLVILLVILRRRKSSLSYLICCAVFGIYILSALGKAFFPLQISGSYVDMMRQEPLTSYINIIPLYFGPFGTLDTAFPSMILNVLLTIPFGFGINFIAQTRAKHFLWLAPAIGFGIETIQLIISLLLGYPYRVVDINDAILNAVGIWIGYGIFRIFAWLYVFATRRFGIEHDGLTAYIYDIVSRTRRQPASP